MSSITDQPPGLGGNGPAPLEATATLAEDAGAANLHKIRDILFGGQMRDLDRRFATVEERLSTEAAEVKEDIRRRIGTLEQFVRTEAEVLAQRIRTEHDERATAAVESSRALQEASNAFDRKLGALGDQLAREQRELRQQLLEAQQRLSDEIRTKVDAVLARLGREAGELRADKADRSALAALFTELAMRLTGEPAPRTKQE
jgi:hypothetical protein